MQRAARVFVLEDTADRIDDLEQTLVGAEITVTTSYDQAVAAFDPPYDLICLDHDLGSADTLNPEIENNGYEFVLWLPRASTGFRPSIIVHTASPEGARAMARELKAKGHRPVVAPFGDEMLGKARRLSRRKRLREEKL